MAWVRLLFLSFLLSLPIGASAQTYLVMVEAAGCAWCARWNEEIAPIYPKTAEGAAAPLRRHDLSDPVPEDMEFARRLSFTPTFVLMRDGREIDRLEGYPGEDFFWGLISQMLERADIRVEDIGS